MHTFTHKQTHFTDRNEQGEHRVSRIVETTIFHNNERQSTGDVHVQHVTCAPDGKHISSSVGFSVPQQALVAFVAELVRGERIAALEQADTAHLLGVGK